MGRKVHPVGFRLKINRDWDARWFAEGRRYAELLHEDLEIRRLVGKDSNRSGISRVEIERYPNQVQVTVHTAKPGIVIGRKGEAVKKLRLNLEDLTSKKVKVEVEEIENPDLDATLVAYNVAGQLERRISPRRAMKRAIDMAMRQGAEGIKIMTAGRLNGAEMSRVEWQREGRVPLQTLRANIDYGMAEADTTYGKIGVKTWIYKGDVLGEDEQESTDVYVSK
jgi:small subunit ribosomal protein S3